MRGRTFVALLLLILVVGAGYWLYRGREASPPPSTTPLGARATLTPPLGLPAVPVPPDNPPTAETIALGRRLYYDPILSVDDSVSCATCHHPGLGFTDGKPVAEGVQKKTGTRNAPTVINAAYHTTQFHDGRALSLEEQAGGPMQNPIEMAHTMQGVEEKLNADPSYREAFKKAFGAERITFGMVTKAIASFERTVIAGNSPFDRWHFGKDEKAVSESVKRGFEVFRDPKKGNCAACHSVGEQNALFTDNKFHNVGVGVKLDKYGNPEFTDAGRFDVTKSEADRGAFKTPSLRNIAQTAPYMHDGSLKTLKDVIDFYVGGGNSNPNLDKEIHTLVHLSGKEREDLLAFLESLTGEFPYEVGPPVRSATPAKAPQQTAAR